MLILILFQDRAPNQSEETVIEEVVNDQTTIIEEVIGHETVVEEVVESSLDTGEETVSVHVDDCEAHNLVINRDEATLIITRDESVLVECSDKLMELAELAAPDHSSTLTVHHIQTGKLYFQQRSYSIITNVRPYVRLGGNEIFSVAN